MIIFGARGLRLNNGKPAEFFCPQCNNRRNYQGKKLQRFFTLYFIPVIPLSVIQEWVECQTCKQTYKPEVLHHDPTAQREARQAQLNDNLRGLLVHFARMSDRRDEAFLSEISGLYKSLTNSDLSSDAITADINQAPINILPAAERVAPVLNDRGREAVVTGLVKLAAPIDATKQAALAEVAKVLNMTDAHFSGVLAMAATPSSG
jgi:hypothetical protein